MIIEVRVTLYPIPEEQRKEGKLLEHPQTLDPPRTPLYLPPGFYVDLTESPSISDEEPDEEPEEQMSMPEITISTSENETSTLVTISVSTVSSAASCHETPLLLENATTSDSEIIPRAITDGQHNPCPDHPNAKLLFEYRDEVLSILQNHFDSRILEEATARLVFALRQMLAMEMPQSTLSLALSDLDVAVRGLTSSLQQKLNIRASRSNLVQVYRDFLTKINSTSAYGSMYSLLMASFRDFLSYNKTKPLPKSMSRVLLPPARSLMAVRVGDDGVRKAISTLLNTLYELQETLESDIEGVNGEKGERAKALMKSVASPILMLLEKLAREQESVTDQLTSLIELPREE